MLEYLCWKDWPGWAYILLTLLLSPPIMAAVCSVLNDHGPDTALGWYGALVILILVCNFGLAVAAAIARVVEKEWPWQ